MVMQRVEDWTRCVTIALLGVLAIACDGAPEPAQRAAAGAAGSGAALGTGTLPGAFIQPQPAAGMSMQKIQAMGAMPSGPGLMMTSTFDGQSSEQVFGQTLYPILREHCAKCHSEAPEGRDQRPLHASADVTTAHMWALSKINLRQVPMSKLVQRQSVEGHNCWSDCKQDGETIRAATQAWADALKPTLPVSSLQLHEGEITEPEVLKWIADDRAKNAGDRNFIKYASFHRLQNRNPSPDEMNLARVGLSKVLNSTAKWAPKLAHPVAIDPYFIVYRFDIRDYWGFKQGGAPNPSQAPQMWERALKGNINADDQAAGTNTFGNKDTPTNSLAKDSPTFPNIAGFYPEYVDGTQLGYTLSRPDVYADIMELGVFSPTLEASLGVQQKGIDTWKFNTVDDAITINKRMLLRTDIPTGYFWKGVDPFARRVSSRDRREVKAAYDRGYQTAYRALTGRLGISGTRLICNQITPPTVAMIAAGLGFSGDQVVVTGDGTGHLGVSDAVVGLQQLQRRGEIDGPIVVGASTAYAFGTGMLVPPDHG